MKPTPPILEPAMDRHDAQEKRRVGRPLLALGIVVVILLIALTAVYMVPVVLVDSY